MINIHTATREYDRWKLRENSQAKVPVRGGDAPAPVYRWPECGFSFCGERD